MGVDMGEDVSSARSVAPDGLVIVDKPAGWTSHDVVGRIRTLARTRRVGHAGTLDPMATGVLVVGIGRATRLLGHISGHDKAYSATIRLGWATVTDDAQGERTWGAPADGLPIEDILAVVERLTGRILQRPSAVSAIKVAGRRAHDRVRAGETVELPARPVLVSVFDIDDRRADPSAGTLGAGCQRRLLIGDLCPRPGPRPRRGARSRRAPHRTAAHPGRWVPRRGCTRPDRAGRRPGRHRPVHRRSDRLPGTGGPACAGRGRLPRSRDRPGAGVGALSRSRGRRRGLDRRGGTTRGPRRAGRAARPRRAEPGPVDPLPGGVRPSMNGLDLSLIA